MSKKVIITIGHGCTDKSTAYNPGAVNNRLGLHEFKIAREIGKYAQKYLNDNYIVDCDLMNYDGKTSLSKRIKKLQDNTYNFIAEMHLNAGGGTGTEVFYHAGTAMGKKAATEICKEVCAEFGWANRGAKVSGGRFGIVDRTVPDAVLVETCFIDKDSEAKKVADSAGQKKAGEAIAKGIATALGLKKGSGGSSSSEPSKPAKPSKPANSTKVNVTYCVQANGRWLPEVKNLEDYAGNDNQPITALMVKVDKGKIKYRVHLAKENRWLNWITGYNKNDFKNGYAGNGKGHPIDGVQIYFYTPDDVRPYQQAYYRVSEVGRSGYLHWIEDTSTANGSDGYAGNLNGKAIDRIQIQIKER